jgi:membrane protease YdiL (CAAX protease family)
VAGVLALAWAAGAALAGHYGIWLSLGSVAIFCGALLLAFDGARLVPLLRPTTAQLFLGVATGAAMVVLTRLVYPVAIAIIPSVANETARLYAAFHSLSRTAAMIALGPVVVGEELVWRGAVYGALTRRWGRAVAVVGGTVLYAAAHAPVGSPLLVATACACGLVWSLLRMATGSLVPTLACHLVWDAVVLIARPLASA